MGAQDERVTTGMVMGSLNGMCSFYTKFQGFTLKDILVGQLKVVSCYRYSPSPITMNIVNLECRGCRFIFDTPRGLSQHLAQTNKTRCRVAFSSSQPQSLIQSLHSEHGLLTSPPNSTSSGPLEWTLGSERPSGHGGIPFDSPTFSLAGNEVMTRDIDDRKFAFH
jgi:hypothetical protein